jgi:hypothetical protein
MILLILLILLLGIGCTYDGRTRRLILGFESLPMDAPEEVAEPVAVVPVASSVAYQTIVVEPPKKKYKKTYRKKTRKRRGNH